jgi:hypothetical protein
MELHRYPPRQWNTGNSGERLDAGTFTGLPQRATSCGTEPRKRQPHAGPRLNVTRGGVQGRRVGRHDNLEAFRRFEQDPREERGPAGPTGPRGGYDVRHSGAIGLHLPRGSMATPLLAGKGRDARLVRPPRSRRSIGRSSEKKAPPGDMECQRSAGSAVDQDAGTLRRAGESVAAMENILGGAEQVARSWQRRKVLPPIACQGTRREPRSL